MVQSFLLTTLVCPVRDVLDKKHPKLRDVYINQLEDYDKLPEFEDVVITGEIVERVAKKLSGSGGLINFDLVAIKRLLLNHGAASRSLRDVIA